jgi:hypothetical protein
MFFDHPASADSPTIEPLRIQKRESDVAEPRAASAASQRANQARPKPSAPPTAALPYPDDRPPRAGAGRLPYPDHDSREPAGRFTPPGATYSPPPPAAVDPSRAGLPVYPSSSPPQPSRLAERRGTAPKPLPDSPGPETPDKDGLFQRIPAPAPSQPSDGYDYQQRYFPPPSAPSGLIAPNPVNRLASTASTSTTRAQRGSPPPPETPILPPDDPLGGGIEARYAAAGIAGTSTLTSLQAQNAAAAQRNNQYGGQPPRGGPAAPPPPQQPPPRPWTPTEQPGSTPHGPPAVYQGASQTAIPPSESASVSQPKPTPPSSRAGRSPASSVIEQDFQRLQVSGSPPPAYSSVSQGGGRPGATTAQGYPNEKAGAGGSSAAAPTAAVTAAAVAAGAPVLQGSFRTQGHPAFANDAGRPPRQGSGSQAGPAAGAAVQDHAAPPPPGSHPASPPPLPEGWIAHLDPSSGQYYYIHLPTQSTQWEFPTGPTPLNLNEPTSPVGSMFGPNPLQSPGLMSPGLMGPYGKQPLASPGFGPPTPGYAESVMSYQSATSTVTGFTGPPPTSGVDVYKVVPTNGVYFGPYLRYANMDLERGVWLGSIVLVSEAPQPPTIHIHQSVDLSPNPRQLKANPISKHRRWTFYRYEVDLTMEDHGSAKWTYAITSHLGCTRYEFLVAGRHETGWRFIATSGNDFSLNVGGNDRTRLGGIGFMWRDIMAKHAECGGFHAQLGLGNQIYGDRLWRELPLLRQWLAVRGKENRKNEAWSASLEEDVTHAYFHYYTSHFDQPHLREAFAQIPYILQLDDHDM